MPNTEKNIQIKETYLATKARREHQVCRVFSVKVQQNKLNAAQREALKMMFVEAKWMYNHILNLSKNENTDIFSLKYTDLEEVKHFTKDKEEVISKLTYLSSQMKQEVLTSIFTSIRSLAKSKKKGNKVGELKFISEYKSINLKQCGISYKIVSKNKIKIQGIKKPLKVNGLDQLKRFGDNYELANAKLLLKPSGYYIAFTVYTERDYNIKTNKPKIGVDYGCQTSFTLSDGRKINALVEESERLKRLQQRIARAKKGSNNRWKLRKKLRKAYEHDTNRKNDMANKLCSMLYGYQVIMQDEQLRAWKIKHGKKVQHSILGRVKTRLMSKEDTVVLNRFVPTTKLCRDCGFKNDSITVRDREFVCPNCGVVYDRDIHAAENMVWLYENIIGVERTEFKRADFDEQIRLFFDKMKHEAADTSVQR